MDFIREWEFEPTVPTGSNRGRSATPIQPCGLSGLQAPPTVPKPLFSFLDILRAANLWKMAERLNSAIALGLRFRDYIVSESET